MQPHQPVINPTDEGLWLPEVPDKFNQQQARSKAKGIGLFPEDRAQAMEEARRSPVR